MWGGGEPAKEDPNTRTGEEEEDGDVEDMNFAEKLSAVVGVLFVVGRWLFSAEAGADAGAGIGAGAGKTSAPALSSSILATACCSKLALCAGSSL